ncbi:hypothetical protein WN093_14370 [Gammaproteobacteria bacterium AS21]|jgi:hypothetical protein
MNVTNSLQTGLIGLNRGLDNNPKAAGDFQGSGKSAIPELASGHDLENAVAETTLEANTAAASTKVVTSISDVLGTNVDVVV